MMIAISQNQFELYIETVYRSSCCYDRKLTDVVAWNLTVAVTIQQSQSTVSLMSVFGWLTILSRVDLNFPTGLTSSAYTSGFGNISTNFWLGLEKTYLLTNSAVNGGKTYRLRIEVLQGQDRR
jgi:Fibrinogen beta and gamma chains, C-terminal globular domain